MVTPRHAKGHCAAWRGRGRLPPAPAGMTLPEAIQGQRSLPLPLRKQDVPHQEKPANGVEVRGHLQGVSAGKGLTGLRGGAGHLPNCGLGGSHSKTEVQLRTPRHLQLVHWHPFVHTSPPSHSGNSPVAPRRGEQLPCDLPILPQLRPQGLKTDSRTCTRVLTEASLSARKAATGRCHPQSHRAGHAGPCRGAARPRPLPCAFARRVGTRPPPL